jgi:hypothetical protein
MTNFRDEIIAGVQGRLDFHNKVIQELTKKLELWQQGKEKLEAQLLEYQKELQS